MQASSTPVHIFLLGRFEIAREDQRVRAADWPRRKAAALLQRLAFERRLLKDQAIDFLWPDADAVSGANNLYPILHALRQILDTTLGPGTADSTFAFKDGVLTLGESVWVDVHAFEQSIKASRGESSLASLQTALNLYAGDLLPDQLYDEWTQVPRDSLRRLYREASLSAAAHYQQRHDYAQAITVLAPAIEHDPVDEVIHRELMRVYTLAGRRHDALRQYQSCVQALAAEFDLLPEAETTALYTQIINGEISAPLVPAPAWKPPTPIVAEIERGIPFVGRDSEFEAVRARLATAWRGQGQAILFAGDAGVGKTRLAYETIRAAASGGMITLVGAAYEQEGQLAYQPFIEAFDRYLAEHQRPPEENPITYFHRRGASDPQQEHWALFSATAAFLTGLTATAPVVLLVDDLHAADETSLQLFHYLARQTGNAPVILLATYREDIAITSASPFDRLLNSLYREHLSETIHLTSLGESAVNRIMGYILGGEPAPELARIVVNFAEGNPFFVEEITRALLKADQLEAINERWLVKSDIELNLPTGLGGVLRERVARLGSGVESMLMAAAVIGREFSFDVLRSVVNLPDEELLNLLDASLSSHILEEAESGYRFRHLLTRSALYDALNRVRRAQLHRRAAEAIELLYSRQVEALAFHYDLSDTRDRALDYLIQAGQKAAQTYAFEVGVHYFERALALMNDLNLSDPARRWPILESLGWWKITLADTPQAVAYFEQALSLPHTDSWQSTHRDRARLHRGAVMTLITTGDAAEAEAHLRDALAEVDEHEDASEYAHVLYNVAQFHWHQGEYREAFEAAEKSLGIAERLDDANAIARAFEMLALACHSLGEWQQGLIYEQRRSALAGSTLDVTEAFDVHL